MNNQPNLGGEPQVAAPQHPAPPSADTGGPNRTLRGILIGVTGTVVLLAAYFALAYLQGLWPYEHAPRQEVVSDDALTVTESNETANWKTYRDLEYGFDISYPRTWIDASVNSDASGKTVKRIYIREKQATHGGCCNGLEIRINADESIASYIGNIRQQTPQDLLREESFTIRDASHTQIAIDTHFGGNARETLVQDGNNLLIFSRGDGDDPVIDQVISTFRFTQ